MARRAAVRHRALHPVQRALASSAMRIPEQDGPYNTIRRGEAAYRPLTQDNGGIVAAIVSA